MRFQKSKVGSPVVLSVMVIVGTVWAMQAGIKILSSMVGETFQWAYRQRRVKKLRKHLALSLGDSKAKMCGPFLEVFRNMFERMAVHSDLPSNPTETERKKSKMMKNMKTQLCSALKAYKDNHFKRAQYSCYIIDKAGSVHSLHDYFEHMDCSRSIEEAAADAAKEPMGAKDDDHEPNFCDWNEYSQVCENEFRDREEVTSFKFIQDDMFDLESDECVLYSFCRKKYVRECSGAGRIYMEADYKENPCCMTKDCERDEYKVLKKYAELVDKTWGYNAGGQYEAYLRPRRGILVAGESCSRIGGEGTLLFEGKPCQPAGEAGKNVAHQCMDGKCTPAYVTLALESKLVVDEPKCTGYCEYIDRILTAAKESVRYLCLRTHFFFVLVTSLSRYYTHQQHKNTI